MKKNVLAIVALAALSFTACKKGETTSTATNEAAEQTADAVVYNVTTAASLINWEANKLAGGGHTGTISIQNGEVFATDGVLTGGKFVIDMTSINVTDLTDPEMKGNLEAHLKGTTEENADHFFNTSQFPTSTFEITNVLDNNGNQIIEGSLTIKGTTHSIQFPAQVNVTDTEVTINSEEFEIDRTLWNVNYNSGSVIKDLAGDKVINDNIKLNVAIQVAK